MDPASPYILSTHDTFHVWLERLTFAALLITVAVIIYFDDLQLSRVTSEDVPTVFNVRIMGVKIMDFMTMGLALLFVSCLFFRDKITVTPFHKNVAWMFLAYWYAGIVGFACSFIFDYNYKIWVQDFQQIIYLSGFFLLTVHLLNTKQRWNIFVICFLSFLAAKNFIICYRTIHGEGKIFGDWAIRASQNSEFTYFPMMFFPLVIIFLKKKSVLLKSLLLAVMFVYLFNAFIGVVRTVWVMLGIGFIYLFFQLDRPSKFKLLLWFTSIVGITLVIIGSFLPRFLTMAWSYKVTSIFDWSIYGDRSNATRTLEVINVTHYSFDHFSFLQGRGLGSWWDDSARRLLPDGGAGFTYKTKFYYTHMYYLTQFLKLGLVATAIYWTSFFKMFRSIHSHIAGRSWNEWEKFVLIGLNIGLLCAVVSSADYVRLYLMIGINLGMCASAIALHQ